MGHDDEVTHSRIIRQHGFERDRSARGAPALVENVSDRLSSERAADMGLTERAVERVGTILIEQVQEARRGAAEVSSVKANPFQEGDGART